MRITSSAARTAAAAVAVVVLGGTLAMTAAATAGAKDHQAVLLRTYDGNQNGDSPHFNVTSAQSPWVLKWSRTCPAGSGGLAQVLSIDLSGTHATGQTIVNDSSTATSGTSEPLSMTGRYELQVSSGCAWSTTVVPAKVSRHNPKGTLMATYYSTGSATTPTFIVKSSQAPWRLVWTRSCPAGSGSLAQALSITAQGKGGSFTNQLVNDSSTATSAAAPPLSATGKFSFEVESGCNWSLRVVEARYYHANAASPAPAAPATTTTTAPPAPTTTTTTPPPPPPPTTTPTTAPGGNTASQAPPGIAGPVPNVTGQNLSAAEATLLGDNLGYTTESSGLFGVVVASDWTVCSQSPGAGATATTVNLVVGRSC